MSDTNNSAIETSQFSQAAITTQPAGTGTETGTGSGSGLGTNSSDKSGLGAGVVYVSPEGVVVRNMREDDSQFAGKVCIDAFESKVEHAMGRENFPLAYSALAEGFQKGPYNYHRQFIAEYEGRRAGIIIIKFNGDKENPDSDQWNQLGCGSKCRMVFMQCALVQNVPRNRCYVDTVCVEDGFRGKGIGKALMTAADQQAAAKGCQALFLYVSSDNRARSLYERHGYHRESTTTLCCMSRCITGKKSFHVMVKNLT